MREDVVAAVGWTLFKLAAVVVLSIVAVGWRGPRVVASVFLFDDDGLGRYDDTDATLERRNEESETETTTTKTTTNGGKKKKKNDRPLASCFP